MTQEGPARTISVIIPSWNTRDLLFRCLTELHRGLQSSTLGPAGTHPLSDTLEVIAVDDASLDGSAEMVASRFPDVKLVRHEKNRGFAASCNDGAAESTGEWLLFLNTDAFVTPAQIWRLRSIAENTGATAVGPQLAYGDGSLQDSGGSFVRPSAVLMTKLGRLVGRDLPGASHRRRVRGTQPCGWIVGACMLVRADTFRAVGGFDENLTYVEDVELGERIRRAGGRLLLAEQVKVTHLGAQSFGQISFQVPQRYRSSQLLLAERYFTPLERIATTTLFTLEERCWSLFRIVSSLAAVLAEKRH